MKRLGIWSVLVVANAVALFCLVNPWVIDWRNQGILFFVLELAALILVFMPVFLYQLLRKKKTIGESLRDSTDALLNAITGWV